MTERYKTFIIEKGALQEREKERDREWERKGGR